jgi:hypothetical protein
MTAKDVIKHSLELCHSVLKSYLADLTDDDLLVRPVPGANHTAWQLGHLLICENGLTELGYVMPALPEGFAEAYAKETAGCDDPGRFHKKSQYLQWLDEQRAATLAHLEALPDADLDKPGPEEARTYAPTVGAMFNTIGIHDMMHAPQITVVRRKLGKPALF